MDTRTYPEGIDCIWLASDRAGHVGAFITAGRGPIPAEALRSDTVAVDDMEDHLVELPRVSQSRQAGSLCDHAGSTCFEGWSSFQS